MASPEQELIRRLFAPLASAAPGAFGLRDDAALVGLGPDEELVVTKDALVAGVHFLADDAPQAIARKALRVNISDLVAKGATPSAYLLAVALPRDLEEGWLDAFVGGLALDQAEFGCALIGGDTVSTPGPVTISVTALGILPRGAMIHRHGARPEDAIYVTGTIGDAALFIGLRNGTVADPGLDARQRAHLRTRYELPRPPAQIVAALRAHATAAMDISDGLAGDLALLCEASGVGAQVDVEAIPLSDAASVLVRGHASALECAISGGDDYEVLCCVPGDRAEAFEADAEACGVGCVRIGTITDAAAGVVLRLADGTVLSPAHPSYSHM